VCTAGIPNSLAVEPRDEFNNLCSFRPDENPTEGYNVAVTQVTVYQIYLKVFKFSLFDVKYEYQLAKLCCGLFYHIVSHSDYITSNGRFIRDGESKRIWEETVMTQLKYCPGIYLKGRSKTIIKFYSGKPMSQPFFNQGIF
jgi:hypothetical protein